jgi:hypothetical protein
MDAQVLAITRKYLALAQAETRKIWDEYYAIPMGNMPQKEAYKLVEKYHQKVRKVIQNLSRQGFAEIEKLPCT